MLRSYDLTKLDEASFEHLANFLALRVLGPGHTGFGPGPDGGRDGYFEGEAPYPSNINRWSGRWYLQSKFHSPHLSKNAQDWLVQQIQEELNDFQKPGSRRHWPDNWIIVTNIDPSGTPQTGSFDKARAIVASARGALAEHFHIWGGAKVLQLLALYPEIADYYSHFLTPGNVLTSLYHRIEDSQADVRSIIRHFVVAQFVEQQFTKLEQAGSASDTRPGIHRLFTDLPFAYKPADLVGLSAVFLARTAAQNHRISEQAPDTASWASWHRYPSRARIWFVKGGPGQGKSTLTQYLSQIQRAALILGPDGPDVTSQQLDTANEIREAATNFGFSLWPISPRIPIYIELKDFAKWYGERSQSQARGVLTFLADRLTERLERPVLTGTLLRALSQSRWLIVFDGLDEVPSDVKDSLAAEIVSFVDDRLIESKADALVVCTSRPQGYSGQFSALDASEIELTRLSPSQALDCATPVLRIDRTEDESSQYLHTLREAMASPSIREIMTTPLQAHIMAVVVRDGGRPPDRKWRLFANFYQVIKKREANRSLPDRKISTILRSGDKLIKALHNRLGYELHARAEKSGGAQTSIERNQLRNIVRQTVSELQSSNVDETVSVLMEATTDRLILVNTPESGAHVRFDIRPLQEFFAAEFIYEDVSAEHIGDRLGIVAGDAHWREVMHFLLSALVENSRRTDLAVAVEKLAFLDERAAGSPARLFYRRLAAGAFIATRLFAEGVLGQDKRVRQQFKRCIEPVFGTTEFDLISTLASVRDDDSVAWLIDVLMDTVLEQSESESIGAAFALCLMLDDAHPCSGEVETLLLTKSVEYRACLFEALSPEDEEEEDPDGQRRFFRWVSRIAVRSVASTDWKRMEPSGAAASFRIMAANEQDLPAIAESVGLDSALAHFLVPLIVVDDSSGPSETENWDGFLSAENYAPDQRLDPASWPEDLRAAIARAPGIFSLLRVTFAVASGSRAENTLNLLIDAAEYLRELPAPWRAYVPVELLNGSIRKAGASRELLTSISLSWHINPGYRYGLIWHEAGEAADYGRFLENHPNYGLNFLTFSHRKDLQDKINEFIDSPNGKVLLEKVCEANVHLLANNPSLWGRLIQICNSDAIRRSVLSASQVGGSPWSSGELFPFVLKLPEEASLLPSITNILFDRSLIVLRRPNNLGVVIKKYVPDIDILFESVRRRAGKKAETGAAAILCLCHPDHRSELTDECIIKVVDCYEPHRSSSYLRNAAMSFEALLFAEDVRAFSAIGRLLRASVGDFRARRMLDQNFANWRQRSVAPVTQVGMESF